jgi:hypothetical protein
MKPIRVLGLIVALCALGYYGYQLIAKPNGKKYEVDKHHNIYYKGDGVNEDDAKKVASYLKETGSYTDSTDMDLQIKAENKSGELTVRFITDKDKITPESNTEILQFFGDMGAREFPGRSIHVILSDDHLKDIQDLGIAKASPQQTNADTETKQTDDAK